LMSGEHMIGKVDSIARAVFDRDNPESRELIADVNPTFNWVRLARRVPVRIKIEHLPDDLLLAAGLTCTVIITPSGEASTHTSPQRFSWAIPSDLAKGTIGLGTSR
jgi:multidrug resistance efflux pump